MASAMKRVRQHRGLRRGTLTAGLLVSGLLVVGGLASPAFADEEYATWDDVVAANSDVDAQQQLVNEIQHQIESLDADVAAADQAAVTAGTAYGDAMEASADKAGEVAVLQQESSDAAALAQASAEQAGRLAAAMANRSGGDPSLALLGQPANADNLLYQLGTISKLSTQTDAIYQDAVAQQNTADSLGEQAQVALAELQKLEADAKSKFDSAQASQIRLQNARIAADSQRAELEAMLIPLREQRDVMAADYEAGQTIQQDRRQQESADRAAAAAAEQERSYEEAVAEAQRAGVEPPPRPEISTEVPPAVAPVAPQTNPDGTLVRPDPVPSTDPQVAPPAAPQPSASTEPSVEPSTDPSTDPGTQPSTAPKPTVDPYEPEPRPSIDPYEPAEKPDIEEFVPEPEPEDGVRHGYAYPIDNAVVTDEYGMRYHPIGGDYRMHTGLDLGVNGGTCGAPLKAVYQGTITYAGYNGGYGNHVVIDFGDGMEVSYSHILDGGINVYVGQHVNAGDVIAYAGTTGSSTGCHLHFEVEYWGELMDPKPWLASAGILYY